MSDVTDPTITPPAPPAPAGSPPAPEGGTPPPAPAPRRAPAEGITAQGLTERLKRERETERKRIFAELGIDDPEKAKTALTEYQSLKKQAEERQRAEMTEIERFKADLAAAQAERDAAKQEAREAREQVDYEKRDNLIRSTAGKYISDKFIRTARVEFKAYVESLSPSQQSKLTDAQMEVWMRRFAKDNPEMARAAGDTSTKPNPIPVEKKPLTNGQTPRRTVKPGEAPAPPPGGNPAAPQGKHVRDMTPAEVTAYARSQGLKSYKAAPVTKAN